ncbi:UNVERIFIED_CONTAM: hypothetical protein FKN15_026969 [Acipenser sinensis]
MDRNALAELLQALESRRDAEERRREERYTALIERDRKRYNMKNMRYEQLKMAVAFSQKHFSSPEEDA